MHSLVRRTVFSLILLVLAAPAAAQSDGPLQQGRGFVFGSLGMQSDLGGAVNESGVGVVNGLRAEIDTNTWGERYDASLNFRIGGAYNLTTYAQLFGEVTWEQSEADATEIGLIGGQPLIGKFSDYQGWGIDVGYRRLFNSPLSAKPFASFAFGFQRLQDITLDLSSTVYNRAEIPFYDDSWVFGWRLGTGFLWDINDRLGWLLTLDLKYSGMLSDQSGIGTVGFERINKGGNRWTVPIMAGAYVKF